MSSGCGDVVSLADLQTAKKHQIFEAEVITGKQGGLPSGASIDYATNQVTGQVQKTMPAVIRDMGFEPASFDFTTGGTLAANDRNKAVLWPLPSGDGGYYNWRGALPKVVPASSTPASSGGVSVSGWQPVSDPILRRDLAAPGGAEMVGTSSGVNLQQNLDNLANYIATNTANITANTNTNNINTISTTVNSRVLGSAKCERKSTPSDLYYNFTKIPKGAGHIRKEYGQEPVYVDGVMHVNTLSMTSHMSNTSAGAISSADGARVGWGPVIPEGWQPWGLQIAGGVAYQDFTPFDDGQLHGQQALIIQKDGSVIPAEYSDGKTAQQYVDEGAMDSFGFHLLLVKNGVAYQSNADTTIKARAVFGVLGDGTYCTLHVQGNTGQFGLTVAQLQALCLELEMKHAVMMDEGGSSQLLWKTTYLQPSSDGIPRSVGGGVMAFHVPIQDFDSGWKAIPVDPAAATGNIYARQIDDRILYKYDFTFIDTFGYVVKQSGFPNKHKPYLGNTDNTTSVWLSPMQASTVGTIRVYADGTSANLIQATPLTGNPNKRFIGNGSFPSRYSMFDYV